MAVDFTSGLASTQAAFDANNDGTIDELDAGYVGEPGEGGLLAESGILDNYQYTTQSDGTILRREIFSESPAVEGRLGWQEVVPK